jgi:hypothetical protein
MPSGNLTSNFSSATQTSDGNASWSDTGNVLVDDGASATVFVDYPTHTLSNYLKVTDRIQKIPSSATVNGIIVEIQISQETGLTLTRDFTVYVLKGATLSTPVVEISSVGIVALGNITDLWGLSWTAADINASDFGVKVLIDNGGTDVTWGIDYINTTIFYTYTETGDGTGRTTQGRRAVFSSKTEMRVVS